MRNCIVVLNLSNLTGTLNHGVQLPNGQYKKLRADFKDLLEYAVGDRNLLGAYVVSQQDTSPLQTRTPEQLQQSQKFLQGLKRFGWTPVRVAYNSQDVTSMEGVLNSIWAHTSGPLVVQNGDVAEWKYTPALVDIVFINGSSLWNDIVSAYFNSGFSVEVAFLKAATSHNLLGNYPFLDLTSFLINNTNKVVNKQLATSKESISVQSTITG